MALGRPAPTGGEAALRAAIDALADQLCVAVDGNFDFAVKAPLEDETLEKLSMLVNFVLDTARRGMSVLEKNNAALAELDRAKTTFFSNISHEFRTPITLLLGPLEDALGGNYGELRPALREQVEVAHRNALRLLKLVNALLEFSRVEAGRTRARFEATELGEFTEGLASAFAPAAERAGLRLVIDCPPLPAPVYVDREMWERIVLNLLSNAVKFTLEGEIRVQLSADAENAVLRVTDTGVGVPPEELPNLFKRFHRVPGVRSRSHEGSGIGLAMAQELAKLHGGGVTAASVEGKGTTFDVRIPRGSAHLPAELLATTASPAAPSAHVRGFAEEALRWMPSDDPSAERAPMPDGADRARILVVDDNADMRTHLSRILEQRWDVELAPDGVAALERLRERRPDLVLSDVMMPRLDGFGLLRAVREDPALKTIPVVLLSARAGEEATIEGLDAGADDYLVKPFSARELLARIASQLSLAKARRLVEEQREALLAREREETRINETLYRIATTFAGELDRQKLVQLVTDEATALTGAQFGAFFFNVKEEGKPAYQLYTLSGAPAEAFGKFPMPRSTPLFQTTFNGEGITRLDDVRKDPRFGAWGPQPKGHLPVVSYLALPVVSRSGEVLGGLFFGHGEPARFTELHERMGRGLAAQAAAALEKARLYEELQRSEARAREADQRKDEFLAMLGHELRNPLAPILTALQLVRLKGTGTKENEVVERQVRHLVRLVDDLLDISRITRGKISLDKERLEISSVVARGVEMASPLLESQAHSLRIDVPREGLPIFADPARLGQIVANLLTNAARYTPPGGMVEITGRRSGESAILSVKDNGRGIDPNLLPHIFDLFVQGKQASDRAGGGLGIGLALVRNLVELHGGRVHARSDGPGLGSEFVVELPLHAGAALPASTPAASQAAAATKKVAAEGVRILVVDDNVDAAEALAEALTTSGYEVAVAHDAPQALEIAKTFHATTAFLDIGLPVMDGYELGRLLRQRWEGRSVQIVALTGYGQEEDKRKAQAAGFDAHLVKPVDLAAIFALLHRHEPPRS